MARVKLPSTRISRQAAYQRRRRAEQPPVTFFPADRARIDRAVDESGLGLQGWIARAVDERIARQAEIAALVDEAFRRFRARCFWNVRADRPLSLLAPLVGRRLRKYGGHEGLRLAAEIDTAATLREAGLRVETTARGNSFVDGAVVDAKGDTTRIQWARDSAVRFFPAIKDRTFGYRLHDLDLAVNKVLAMAGRREPRDYYDVIKLHEAGKPLAMLAWAAPAKDPGFTPELIVDEVNRNSNYAAGELPAEFADADPRAMKKILLAASREARDLFARLPLDQVGRLYLDRKGRAVLPDPQGVAEKRLVLHGAVLRGAWPTLTDKPAARPRTVARRR
jgi:hypothetical protein